MNRGDYIRCAVEWAEKAADFQANGVQTGPATWSTPKSDYSMNSAMVASSLAQTYAALAAIHG